MSEHTVLEVKHVNSFYRDPGQKRQQVLKDVTFQVREGEILGLVGESGCGKSTLSKAILGFIKDYEGEIIHKTPNPQMVFQDPFSSLNPSKKIGWILEEPLRHNSSAGKEERRRKVEDMIEKVGLSKEYLGRYPRELSGGQRQRVSIAISLIQGSQFIIADEPVSALDVTIQEQILNLIAELNERMGMSVLFITHDLGAMAQICHSVRVMYLGNLVEEAQAEALFARPLHPYTQGLLDCIPRLDSDRSQPLHVISGVVPPLSNVPEGCRFCTRCPYADQRCMLQNPPSVEVYPGHKAKCWKYVTEQEVM